MVSLQCQLTLKIPQVHVWSGWRALSFHGDLLAWRGVMSPELCWSGWFNCFGEHSENLRHKPQKHCALATIKDTHFIGEGVSCCCWPLYLHTQVELVTHLRQNIVGSAFCIVNTHIITVFVFLSLNSVLFCKCFSQRLFLISSMTRKLLLLHFAAHFLLQ